MDANAEPTSLNDTNRQQFFGEEVKLCKMSFCQKMSGKIIHKLLREQ